MTVSRQDSLQDAINTTKSGETLHLLPGEYKGPIEINKPIQLLGKKAIIWASEDPVLQINSVDVSLKDIRVEVIGECDGEDNFQKY